MDKKQLDTDIANHPTCKAMGIVDPKTRLKALTDRASAVEINHNKPPKMYYRGGTQMITMANMYEKEGNIEDAYILYIRFITLFVEKIRNHQQYHTVSAKDRETNREWLRQILPKAEELKMQLLKQYQAELERFLKDTKEKEKAEKERLKREEQQRLKEEEDRRHKMATLAAVRAAKIELSEALAEENKRKSIIPSHRSKVNTLDHGTEKSVPMVDRSTKPTTLLSDNVGLRDIIVPGRLMQDFLSLAYSNTMNNVETCGILAGRLEKNKLLITHLLIPQQTGSPDSCLTLNEENIFDYQDQHNLITLGWIHTHPTQTAFLSSVDLHTHCSYQLMMAEAIAIVCAPKYEETGFFILTPDYGLDYIANCKETGFHPHPNSSSLYMEAKHYKLDSTAYIQLVDLRRK